jgi:hypothetical protein
MQKQHGAVAPLQSRNNMTTPSPLARNTGMAKLEDTPETLEDNLRNNHEEVNEQIT